MPETRLSEIPFERPLGIRISAPSPAKESAWNLSRYLVATRTFPMLSPEEEVSIAQCWRQRADATAMTKLVTSHLRLVTKIAMGYRGYRLPLNELIAEGNLGLVQAAKKFDPDRGCRFATYATCWIRAAIQQYVLYNSSLVKMGTTAAQKKLFFSLRRLKGQLQAIEDGDLSPENVAKIAAQLDVPAAEVVSMNSRLASPDHSLNAPLRDEGEGDRQDWLADESDDQEVVLGNGEELRERRKLLRDAMTRLDARERNIVTHRWLREHPSTLDELSLAHKLSRERIRQIEVRALEKLRRAVAPPMLLRRRRECSSAGDLTLRPSAPRGP